MGDPAQIFLEADWRQPVTVSTSFKTDIFSSRAGYETRSALREFPRVQTEYTLLGGRGNDPGWKGLLASNLARNVEFPDLTRKTNGTVEGPGFVSGAFDLHFFSTGKPVFVEKHGEVFSTTVASNSGTILGLEDSLPLSTNDPVFIYPGVQGRITKDLRTRHLVSSVFESSVSFEAYRVQDRVKGLLSWSPTLWYRNRPVILWKPNWAERVQEDWGRAELGFDPGYGKTWFEAKQKSPRRNGSYRVLLRDNEDVDEVLSFFCYCRGRQSSFYAPTWVDDFVFTAPLTEGQTVVRVKGASALSLFEGSDTFKSVSISHTGRVHLSGIQDMYAVGRDSEVVLSVPVPVDLSGATRASWLLRQRFSSDDLELEFRTDRVAEMDVKTVSVIEDFEVLRISQKDVTVGSAHLTIGSVRDLGESVLTTSGGHPVTVGRDFLA